MMILASQPDVRLDYLTAREHEICFASKPQVKCDYDVLRTRIPRSCLNDLNDTPRMIVTGTLQAGFTLTS